ncbi:MAG: hypothetical protein R2763_17225 [Mycobacterium sp.]
MSTEVITTPYAQRAGGVQLPAHERERRSLIAPPVAVSVRREAGNVIKPLHLAAADLMLGFIDIQGGHS